MPRGGAATRSRSNLRHSTFPPQNHNTPWRSMRGPLPWPPGSGLDHVYCWVSTQRREEECSQSYHNLQGSNTAIISTYLLCERPPTTVRRRENLELSLCILQAYKTVGIGLGWMWLKALVKAPDLVKAPWKDSVVIWLLLRVCGSVLIFSSLECFLRKAKCSTLIGWSEALTMVTNW